MFDVRSMPALTRRMKPLLCVKSKSPWNEPTGCRDVDLDVAELQVAQAERRGSRFGSSLADDADLADRRGGAGAFSKWIGVGQRLAQRQELLRAEAQRAVERGLARAGRCR